MFALCVTKRKFFAAPTAAGIIVAVGLATALCGCGSETPRTGPLRTRLSRENMVVGVVGQGRVESEFNRSVTPPRSWGLKIATLTPEGEKVKKGDIVITLDTSDLENGLRDDASNITAAEASLTNARENLAVVRERVQARIDKAVASHKIAGIKWEVVRAGHGEAVITEAKVLVMKTSEMAEHARDEMTNWGRLVKSGAASQVDLEVRELKYEKARIELEKRKLELRLLKAGSTAAELRLAELERKLANINLEAARDDADHRIALAQQSVRKAQAVLKLRQQKHDKTERLIDACSMRAPVDGTVFHEHIHTREGKEKVREGMEVRPWHRLVSLPDVSRLLIRVKIEEPRIAEVKIGLSAVITLESLRGESFAGRVYQIDPVARSHAEGRVSQEESRREEASTKVFDVLIAFDESDPRIAPGLSGEAKIVTARLTDVLVVPVEAVYHVGGQNVVYLADGDETVVVPVTLGPESAGRVVVTKGLHQGQEVYLTLPPGPSTGPGQAGARSGGRLFEVPRGALQLGIRTTGSLRQKNFMPVTSRVSGKIEWLIDEGTSVKAGDVIARVEDVEYREQLEDAQLNLAIVNADLTIQELKRDHTRRERERDIEIARVNVETAEIHLALLGKPTESTVRLSELNLELKRLVLEAAKRENSRLAGLAEKGIVDQRQISVAKLKLEGIRVAHAKVTLEHRLLLAETPEEDLAVARQHIKRARTALSLAGKKRLRDLNLCKTAISVAQASVNRYQQIIDVQQQRVRATEVTAPIAGTVVYPRPWGTPRRVGDALWRSNSILEIADMDTMVVEALVNQVDWPHVKLGQDVEVVLTAAPEKTFTGKVISVGGLASDRYLTLGGDVTGVMTFQMTVLIEENSPLLRPTYTARLNIRTHEYADVCYVPRTAVGSDSEGNPVVGVRESDRTVPRRVKTGASDAVHVVITEGLKPGETVVVPVRK